MVIIKNLFMIQPFIQIEGKILGVLRNGYPFLFVTQSYALRITAIGRNCRNFSIRSSHVNNAARWRFGVNQEGEDSVVTMMKSKATLGVRDDPEGAPTPLWNYRA